MNSTRYILITGVSAALILLGTVIWSSLGLDRAAQGLHGAEAADYARQVEGLELSSAGLAAFAEERPDLIWIGLGVPFDQEMLLQSGPGPELERGPPIQRLDDGTIFAMHPPRRDLAERMKAAGLMAGRDRPPPVAVQFRPTMARSVANRARISVGVALFVAALLVFASVGLARSQERAEQARAELADSAHLARMGVMTAVLAHEIKNPLASLKGHAQLLQELLAESEHERRAKRVADEAVRLEELIEALLAFARRAEIRPVEVDVARFIDDLYGAHELVAVTVPTGLQWRMDRGLVQRAVQNLVSNALQAGEGSPVDVVVRRDQTRVAFVVRDRGPGLGGRTPDELFAPFVTTRTRGTGLGLSIAVRIAMAHNGSLHAEDHVDGGAVFTLTLGEV